MSMGVAPQENFPGPGVSPVEGERDRTKALCEFYGKKFVAADDSFFVNYDHGSESAKSFARSWWALYVTNHEYFLHRRA